MNLPIAFKSIFKINRILLRIKNEELKLHSNNGMGDENSIVKFFNQIDLEDNKIDHKTELENENTLSPNFLFSNLKRTCNDEIIIYQNDIYKQTKRGNIKKYFLVIMGR